MPAGYHGYKISAVAQLIGTGAAIGYGMVAALILFVVALGPGQGNRVLVRLGVAVFVLGLLAGAVLRPAAVLMTGGWASLSRVAMTRVPVSSSVLVSTVHIPGQAARPV